MGTTFNADLLKSVSDLVGVGAPLVTSFLIALLIGIVCWRTRSIHLINVRLWHLVVGKSDTSDREFAQTFDARHNLLKFRFHTGLASVRTWGKAKELMNWAARHDEELGDIKVCGHWFDSERIGLKQGIPGGKGIASRALLLILTAWAVLLLSSLALSNKALLHMKASGTLFSLSTDSAQGLLFGQRVTPADCIADTDVAQKLKITKDEATAICNAFKDVKETNELVTRSVKEQHWLFGTPAISAAYLATLALLALRRLAAAQEMRARLNRASALQPASPSVPNDSKTTHAL